jgi:twitching motility protein PilU
MQTTHSLNNLLYTMLEMGASDLLISAYFPPSVKVDGELIRLSEHALDLQAATELVFSTLNDKVRFEFKRNLEANFSLSLEEDKRFRVSAFMQQGRAGMVIRAINSKIPSFEGLHLPEVLQNISLTKRGIVLLTGSTGSGKTTSLAAMIDYRNTHSHGHIISIEDPIEFMHVSKLCMITQREIGMDTHSWQIALKNTLRQAPDMIVLGEIRDKETMEYAIQYAETGHLCIATLHANNSNQAIDRILNFFPNENRKQILIDISLNLRAIISQRLIRQKTSGRVPAVEVMLGTPLISDLIFKGEIHALKDAIKQSKEQGMICFDDALFNLYEEDKISYENALKNADSENDLRLKIKLYSQNKNNGNPNGNDKEEKKWQLV